MKTLLLMAALVPSEDTLVGAVNAERVRRGLPALTASKDLHGSADRFAGRLLRRERFAHERRIRIQRARYSHVGEALALDLGPDRGHAATVRAWMGSPPHRRLVLTRVMRLVGAGYARGAFNGRAATIRVLHLASAPSARHSRPSRAVR